MKGNLFVIIGTPESGRRSTLSHAISKIDGSTSAFFLLPQDLEIKDLPGTHWTWQDDQFNFQLNGDEKAEEWFLFLSYNIDLADQIEGVYSILENNEGLVLTRILTFINASKLKELNKQLEEWLDACAHFSDVMCFINRLNDNASFISNTTSRFKSMCYPMETFILSYKKTPPIDRLLAPIARRMTHIFELDDDTEDLRENDPFLLKYENGNRVRTIRIPSF